MWLPTTVYRSNAWPSVIQSSGAPKTDRYLLLDLRLPILDRLSPNHPIKNPLTLLLNPLLGEVPCGHKNGYDQDNANGA
jgi:hypothetical protein